MSRALLACSLLFLVGCQGFIEAIGYTVVDEELQKVCAARDDATVRYVDATLPLVATLEGDRKDELADLGETLKRVSALERKLLCGDK